MIVSLRKFRIEAVPNLLSNYPYYRLKNSIAK